MAERTQARALVIDPSPLFCEGIADHLSRGGHTVLAHAPDEATGLQCAHSLEPNLVVLGPHLEADESLALCREITRQWPGIKMIVITGQADDPLFQADAACSGASACLPAEVSGQGCLSAIEAVMGGHLLFSREVLSQAFQPIRLSVREQEVLDLLAQGKSDREIAAALVLAVSTVRNHAQRLLAKLGVHSRAEAVQRARRRGWV